jgi:thioesterase domain-containing protein
VFGKWLGYELDEEMLSRRSPEEQAAHIARSTAALLMLPPDIAESRRQVDVYRALMTAALTYVASPYAGRITLLRATQAVAGGSTAVLDRDYGWSALSREPVEVYDLPGTHFNVVFEPHVRALAAVLRRLLATP